MAVNRLSAVASHLIGSVDPSEPAKTTKKWTNLPSFDDLPRFHDFPGCAWGLWGEGDELGTINLLTEDIVCEAAKEVRYALAPL